MRRNTRKLSAENNPAPAPYTDAVDGRGGEENAAIISPGDGLAVNGKPTNGKRAPASAEPDISFWDQLADLGEEKWASGNYEVRVYRVWPVVERKQPDGVYIGLFKEPVDEPMLLERFGGGRYLLLFRHRGKMIRKFSTTVGGNEVAPKVDESEVLRDDPANERFFRIWGKKASDGASTRTDKEQGKKDKDTVDIAEVIRAHAEGTKADPQLVAAYQDTAAHRDELAVKLAELSAGSKLDIPQLITAIKSLMPSTNPIEIVDKVLAVQKHGAGGTNSQSETMSIISALKSMQPPQPDMLAVLAQAKALFSPAKDGESSRIAELRELLEFSQILLRGTNPRTGWDTAVDAIRDVGLPVVQTVGGIISQAMALRHGQPVPGAAAPPIPTAWDPYRNPTATAAYAASMRNQSAQQPQPQQPSQPTPHPPQPSPQPQPGQAPQQPANELMMLFQNYGQIVLNSLNAGTPGYEFADYVVGLLGAGTHAVIANFGPEALVSTMMSIPEFQVFGQPRLTRFAEEFINYQEFGDDGKEETAEKAAAGRG